MARPGETGTAAPTKTIAALPKNVGLGDVGTSVLSRLNGHPAVNNLIATPGAQYSAEAVPSGIGANSYASPLAAQGPGIAGVDSLASDALASGASAHQGALQAAAEARLQAQAAAATPVVPAQNSHGYGVTTPSQNFTGYQVSGGGLSPKGFADDILKGLGDKITPSAEQGLERWEAQEGGNWHNDASYNPLNTTQSAPGYHEVGTQGNIGAYTDWNEGVNATLKTLENGRYAAILQALKGNNYRGILDAIDASPWGTKGL